LVSALEANIRIGFLYCCQFILSRFTTGCTGVKHPRAEGYKDSTTSLGWYSVFRGLALDLSGTLTGVYAVLNMHGATAVDPMYQHKIVRYLGTDCAAAASWEDCVIGSANARDPSHTYAAPGTVDAMASNEATGDVIYKVSPTDGSSTAILRMLDNTLTPVMDTTIKADLLNTKATAAGCAACATAHDAVKFEVGTDR